VGARDELVEAFTAAVPFAVRELAGVEAVVQDLSPAAVETAEQIVAGIVLTFADGQGMLVLSFPAKTADELTRRILAGTAAQLSPDLIRDCMCEVANVVAGQAKALLVGSPSHFVLSTPVIATAGPAERTGSCKVRFASDAGPFDVCLSRPL
jgi:CheY-specific phosphatase CheX